MEVSSINDSTDSSIPLTCSEYKDGLVFDTKPFEILSLITPRDPRIWSDRSEPWFITLKVYAGLASFMYLMLAMFSVIMIFKKDCIRIPTKTFFAVYLTIAILGFSRLLHLTLDPYGLFGFLKNMFSAWIIVSRFLAGFGFPSLVASYTLMIFTLLKLPKASVGKQWYQYWKYVVPIVVVPYIIALVAEVISYVTPYPAVLIIIACEAFFSLWGFVVCIAYLFAGMRLLKEFRFRQQRTMRMSASVTHAEEGADQSSSKSGRNDFVTQELNKQRKKTRNTTRKISIITYVSAIMGVMYSLVSVGSLTMICLLVFEDCLGFNKRGSSALWLGFQIATRLIELILAMVILYSITDISGVIHFMQQLLTCKCCRKNSQVMQCSRDSNTLASIHSTRGSDMSMTLANSTKNTHAAVNRLNEESPDNDDRRAARGESVETQSVDTMLEVDVSTEQLPDMCTIEVKPASCRDDVGSTGAQNPMMFTLNAQLTNTCISPALSVSEEAQTTSGLISTATSTDTAGSDVAVDSSTLNTTQHTPQMATAATQTVEQRTIAVQTEPPVTKPVPKPRRFTPGKSPRETRRQRLRQQKQLSEETMSKSRWIRKQTV